ncbi:Zn-dependent exopeptidase [Neoconidiobolus thromboides FSU 785]|nr:Zn-dependent exopeptidase [Neoconidiobolus thromboides FSU 785]
MKSLINLLLLSLLPLASAANPEGKRLIQTSESEAPKWVTEAEVFQLLKQNKHFFDITDNPKTTVYQPDSRSLIAFPAKVSYPTVVKKAQSFIDQNTMSQFLERYSAFHNRYYASNYGVQAVNYLMEEVKKAGAALGSSFNANFYKHSWVQNSIIARIEGEELKDEIIVIGAHLDSINSRDPTNGRAPGADDDGSGTTTILEALRCLSKSNLKFKRSIEFQFYAAEEVGLRGSQDIAQAYAKQSKKVVGMIQLDMTGYNVNKQIKLLTDYVDPELTQFLRLIIDNYSSYKWINGQCGYACSDHASYTRAGYKSCQPGEDILNNRLHTTSDTTQFVNYNHVSEFVKLALGFAIELAEPKN